MSQDPVRWIDDAAFEAETGCRLAQADRVYTGYDLDGIRARAFAPVAPRPWWRRWGAAGGAAIGVGAILFGSMRGAPPAAPAVLQAVSVSEAPGPVETATAPVRTEIIAPRPSVEVVAPSPRVVGAPAPLELPSEAEPTPAVVLGRAPAADRLKLENAAIEEARDRLAAGEADSALAAFEGYLAAWPDGRLRPEAELGRLDTLFELGRWTDLEREASRAAELPALSAHREAIRTLEAYAAAELGACDRALEISAHLSRSAQTSIRKRCRR